MRSLLSVLLIFPAFLLLTACETIPQKQINDATDKHIHYLPVATPVQINYQDEVNLFRINQIIAEQKELNPAQRARLYYDRSLIYDRMGLIVHSRYNLTQAITNDPGFAPAYNSLGVYLLLSRAYDDAFEAFDSALELSEEMQYSYLHRAIGLYFIQRYSLASKDIDTFYALDENDPYRILWRYIINSKIDSVNALTALQNARKEDEDDRFAWLLVDVIAGRVDEKAFFENVAVDIASNQELAQRLCEAYFYLAHWYKLSGDLDKAIYYFKLSMSTNIHDFIEYKYSLLELSSIEQMLNLKQKR